MENEEQGSCINMDLCSARKSKWNTCKTGIGQSRNWLVSKQNKQNKTKQSKSKCIKTEIVC